MSWVIVTDHEDGVDYAALLKNKALYDLRVKKANESVSVGDVYSVAVDRYHPELQAYSVILPSGTRAHLPKPKNNTYNQGHFVIAQVRRLADGDKDILLTPNITQKETDLSTLKLVQAKKLLDAPDLSTQLRQAYPDLDIKSDEDDFDHHDLWPVIENLQEKDVILTDGVSLVIETTTALTAIDVNSAGQVSATRANIIAAQEISRQIRLRNTGGIIMADFINMKESSDRDGVKAKLKKAVADDPCSIHIYDFTALNLLELSRKRIGNPISSILS